MIVGSRRRPKSDKMNEFSTKLDEWRIRATLTNNELDRFVDLDEDDVDWTFCGPARCGIELRNRDLWLSYNRRVLFKISPGFCRRNVFLFEIAP